MAGGHIQTTEKSINELHNGSIVRLKISVNKAARIWDIWKSECACGSGVSEISECPGPPSEKLAARVLAWIKDDCKKEVPDVWPFREIDFWDNCIERDAIL